MREGKRESKMKREREGVEGFKGEKEEFLLPLGGAMTWETSSCLIPPSQRPHPKNSHYSISFAPHSDVYASSGVSLNSISDLWENLISVRAEPLAGPVTSNQNGWY